MRSRRLARRWTQEEFARRLNYGVTYVRKVEWGERRASEPLRVRIAQVLAVPLSSLPRSAPSPSISPAPEPKTPLIGRAGDLAAVVGLFEDGARLVTLVGAPGIGKTRLAIALATHFDALLPGGSSFVSLIGVPDPEGVPDAICHALDMSPPAAVPAVAHLVEGLGAKDTLLVLDNFEHVVDAAGFVAVLLAQTDRLRLLVTSRQGLDIDMERRYNVPPLEVPGPADATIEASLQTAAVSLFVDRARQLRPDFTVVDADAAAVAEICARLEGIPLAIELAAGALRFLTPKALLAQLGNGLDVPVAASRDAPEHHQTLRAAIGWSFELLGPHEHILMSRLAVFPGGCTLDSAAAVCQLPHERMGQVGAGLMALAAKSLVHPVPDAHGGTRFVVLESVRAFALERLTASGDEGRFQRRHAEWAVDLVARAAPRLTGPEQASVLVELEAEHANIRAAITWSLKHHPASAIRLCAPLWRFWWMRGHLAEGRQWLDAALAGSTPDEPLRALALTGAGVLARTQGAYSAAREFLEQGAALSRGVRDQTFALSLINLGILAEHQADQERALSLFQESKLLFAAIGDSRGVGHSLNCLANLRLSSGDHVGSAALFEEALTIFREAGDDWSVGMVIANLGWVAHKEGRNELARSMFEKGLTVYRALRDDRGLAHMLLNLGIASHATGSGDEVAGLFEEALVIFSHLGDRRGVCECIEALASARRAVSPRGAVVLLGAAGALREAIGAPLPLADQAARTDEVELLRRHLGEATFEVCWHNGRTMRLDDIVAVVLGGLLADDVAPPSHPA